MKRTATVNIDGDAYEVNPAGDQSTFQAIEITYRLISEGLDFSTARVDRQNGLLLLGESGNWYFTTPLCGYGGAGPDATAEILELLGFGTKAEILAQVRKANRLIFLRNVPS